MDTPAEPLIMNSCQYTPVYFIENPDTNQARYVLAQNNHNAEKPVSDSLKRFYENSGKLETNLNLAESVPKQKILKKIEGNVIGNNLKLASFLLPKCEPKIESCKQVVTPVNNVVLKPVYIANHLTPNSTPKLDVNSKIVKLKDLPNVIRAQNGKILPKIKPKDNATSNKSKLTSVQLLKLGETYHSLNQLSDDQMKIVNHALKIFSNPQGTPPEPTYDPVTNTKFIYKVVSPKDLAVVGKNKINKQRKIEIKKEIVKTIETNNTEEFDPKIQLETKVTRSGRIVKLPRNMLPEESPNKPKKKNGQKFNSPHRLHRHYEHHPTHLPSKLHSDLFQCLLAIVKTSSMDGVSFVQHLDQFIKKLKSCLPCLLKTDGHGGQPSVINDDVGRLLGINPGKYNLNMDALNCEKDKNGYCCHNQPPPPVVETKEINIPTININNAQIIKPMNIDKPITNNIINMGTVSVSQMKRPIVITKIDNKRHTELPIPSTNEKKIKLTPEQDADSFVIDDIVALLNDTNKTESSVNIDTQTLDNIVLSEQKVESECKDEAPKLKSKPAHIQFHSTHFDIRSSPIKSSSTVFRKFQINPEKMAKYEVEIIRPIQLNKLAQEIEKCDEKSESKQGILDVNNVNNIPTATEQITYTLPKEWSQAPPPDSFKCENLISDQSDDFLKSEALIEPSLLHVRDVNASSNTVRENDVMTSNDISASQGQSIISFLESLGNELTNSETAIRNNSMDFQLDLFSFNNC